MYMMETTEMRTLRKPVWKTRTAVPDAKILGDNVMFERLENG
jgi:hypothetical protein